MRLTLFSVLFYTNLLQASFFSIQQFEIDTENPVSTVEVEKMLRGFKGKNLWWVKSAEVLATLNENPWIENIWLKKQFPSTLKVSIKTKKPVALIKQNNELYFIDASSEIIDRYQPLSVSSDLPIVSFDSSLTQEFWKLPSVLEQLANLQRKVAVREVRLGFYPEFSLILRDQDIKVYLDALTYVEGLQRLMFLLENPPESLREVHWIDLTNPKKAVVSSRISK